MTPASPGTTQHTLYVLDERSVGLHTAHVERLTRMPHRRLDAENTVVVIEHSLDGWAEADWTVDPRPQDGDRGGEVVTQAPPEALGA